jgi:hypothetical protein
MSDAIVDTEVLMIISVGGMKHHELRGNERFLAICVQHSNAISVQKCRNQ